MKISQKISVFVLVFVLAPLILMSIIVNRALMQSSFRENYAVLSGIAQDVADDADAYCIQTRADVKQMSQNPLYAKALEAALAPEDTAALAGTATRSSSLAAAGDILVSQTQLLSYVKGAYLLDGAGRVVFSTVQDRLNQLYADGSLPEAIRYADTYSSPILHTGDNKPYFYVASPIVLGASPAGFLVVEFDTGYFSKLARGTAVGTTGYVFFVDDSDDIFAHRYPERQLPCDTYQRANGFYQNYIKLRNDAAASRPAAGEIAYVYNDLLSLHGAYCPVEGISGYLFAVRSTSEVRGIFGKPALAMNLLAVMTGLLAIIAAAVITVGIKRPSLLILRSVDSILKKSGYVGCDYNAKNELGQIAKAVNQLNADITNAMDDLRENEKRYRTALEAVSDIVWEYDVTTQKYTFMAKDKGMLGARRVENVEIVNCPWAYAADPEAERRRDSDFKNFVSGDAHTYRSEYETRDIQGNAPWAESIATALKNKDDKIVKVIGSITDITQKKLYDIKVLHSAEYDKLTSIYNRATIEKKVKEELKSGSLSALMMIDLDNFKVINDTFGHQFGDQILQFVSASICKVVTSQDLVGRIGGDEFIVFVREYETEEALEEIANKIVSALQSGYEKEGTTHRLSGSVGVAKAGEFGATGYKKLLENADFAMYSAKRRGKNKYCLFTGALHEEKVKNDIVAEHLKDLANNDILTLALLPVWCSSNGRIVGFYADIDITIPEYGDLTRREIYKIAAESNQQSALLEITFRKVCRAIKAVEQDNTFHTCITYCLPLLSLSNETLLSVLVRVAQEEAVDTKNLAFSLDSKTINSFDKMAYGFVMGLRKISTEIELLGFGGMNTSYNIVSDFHFDGVRFADDVVSKAIHSRKHLAILQSIMDIARQTATSCTLNLTKEQKRFFADKLTGCYYYCTEEQIGFEEFRRIIQTKDGLMNKYECPSFKTRLLENTIMGL